MDRNEFVATLRGALQGQISDSLVEEHVSYYYHYISEEIAKGAREEAVLEMLGDPRLIAKTIIDTADGQRRSGSTWTYTEGDEEPQKGFHAQENGDGGVDLHYGRLNLNTWYGKLLIIAIIVFVLYLVFRIVGGILSLILPILIPVLVIVFVIRLFTGK